MYPFENKDIAFYVPIYIWFLFFFVNQEHIRKKQGHSVPKVIFLVNQVALAKQQGDECSKQLKRYSSKVISGETQRGRNEYLKDFIDK